MLKIVENCPLQQFSKHEQLNILRKYLRLWTILALKIGITENGLNSKRTQKDLHIIKTDVEILTVTEIIMFEF